MAAALAFVVGVAIVRLARMVGRDLLAAPTLQRENHRGVAVPTAGGVYIVLGLVALESARAVLGALEVGAQEGLTQARAVVLYAVLGFGFLGLVDDLLATGTRRGFRGHVGALARGELTTGLVKLVGGGALAVTLVAAPGFASGRRLVIDAVLIALAANLANLFDRAPGRTLKIGLALYVPLAVALGAGPVGVAVAPVVGGAAGLLGDDLRERLMLGDTGANVLGATLGLGVVLGTGETTRLATLAVLVLLNAASEAVSFSRVIERVRPLRALDHLGRRAPAEGTGWPRRGHRS